LLLLPFILGLYLADFRQNTDNILKTVEVFSAFSLLLWCAVFLFKRRELYFQMLLLLSFFLLGYWHMYLSQAAWLDKSATKIPYLACAQLHIEELATKKEGQLIVGSLNYISQSKYKFIRIDALP
jgi:hypothetical protein